MKDWKLGCFNPSYKASKMDLTLYIDCLNRSRTCHDESEILEFRSNEVVLMTTKHSIKFLSKSYNVNHFIVFQVQTFNHLRQKLMDVVRTVL